MTRDEFAAVVGAVLDAPRTDPDRFDTIMRAHDICAATTESAAYDRGYDTGHEDAEGEADFHQEMADRIAGGEL